MIGFPHVARPLSAAAALLLVVSACTGGASPAPTGQPSPTGTPPASEGPSATPEPSASGTDSAVLLEVTSEGGFINPVSSLAALPIVIVYADGRILTQAGPPSDLPDALLPRVDVRDTGADGAAAIAAAIHGVGLDAPQTGDPGVAVDSGTSIFTVTVGGATTTSRFAASGPGGPGGPGVPGGGGGDPERTAAFELLNRLLDTTDDWGTANVAETTYAPVGFKVYAAPADPGGSSVAWPLATELASFGRPAVPDLGMTGLRTGIVLGADAAALGPVLEAASAGTVFTSGGTTWAVYARPLLPHELGG